MDSSASKPPKSFSKFGCAAAILLFLVAALGLVVPAISRARQAARVNSCICRFKQLGLAILNYENTYKTLPPAYIADAEGKPMHSWRVLILPYMEGNEIYKKYNFDEPWNGPNNSKLADQIGSLYRCPEAHGDPLQTNYVAVVGSQALWPGSKGRLISQVIDGTSKTISLVEVADSGIHWMEPRDLTFDEAAQGVQVSGKPGAISSRHPGGANVGFADAHVIYLPLDISLKDLRAMLTADRSDTFKDPRW